MNSGNMSAYQKFEHVWDSDFKLYKLSHENDRGYECSVH